MPKSPISTAKMDGSAVARLDPFGKLLVEERGRYATQCEHGSWICFWIDNYLCGHSSLALQFPLLCFVLHPLKLLVDCFDLNGNQVVWNIHFHRNFLDL